MRTRGFTLIELLVAMAIISVLLSLALPSLARSRLAARKLKDAAQIRTIHQGLAVWAGQHRDWYPLPSMVDQSDTIPGIDSTPRPCGVPQQHADLKNLPRWIVSLMIFNGSIQPETCVSPGEVNTQIQISRVYEFSDPSAISPSKRSAAVLDPAYACYPYEDGGDLPISSGSPFPPPASFSYAISPPVGRLLGEWKSTSSSARCPLGNRGPWYRSDGRGGWNLDPSETRGQPEILAKDSNTLRFWGRRADWAGNVARNDGSVTFEVRPDPESLRFAQADGAAHVDREPQNSDNLFVNEDQSPTPRDHALGEEIELLWRSRNNFLRCYGGNGDSWRNLGGVTDAPLVPSRIWFD